MDECDKICQKHMNKTNKPDKKPKKKTEKQLFNKHDYTTINKTKIKKKKKK